MQRGAGVTPAWLQRDVLADPRRFGLLRASEALPAARLEGPRSLAIAAHEVLAASPERVQTAVLGLAGPSSPLPAAMAQELARLEPEGAAGGLLSVIEHRLLSHLVLLLRRRAVDDAEAFGAMLERLAGLSAADERPLAGRLCDGPTADAVARRLAAVAACPVAIHVGTGGALPSGPGTGCALGTQRLGSGQVLDGAVTAAEFGCRIELGPVTPAHAARLRPEGASHPALLAAIARALPPCLRWRLHLLVLAEQATGLGSRKLGADLRLDGVPDACASELLAAG